jgi:hypothetical protein
VKHNSDVVFQCTTRKLTLRPVASKLEIIHSSPLNVRYDVLDTTDASSWNRQRRRDNLLPTSWVDCVLNVMAHAQKSDFVFRRNGRVYLNRRGRQFIRLLTAEVCASAVVMVVMLDTPCSEAVWRVLATHSIRQFPLHFPSRASPFAITFQLDSTKAVKYVSADVGFSFDKMKVTCCVWSIFNRIESQIKRLAVLTANVTITLFCDTVSWKVRLYSAL